MPKNIRIGQCFTELFKKITKSGTFCGPWCTWL